MPGGPMPTHLSLPPSAPCPHHPSCLQPAAHSLTHTPIVIPQQEEAISLINPPQHWDPHRTGGEILKDDNTTLTRPGIQPSIQHPTLCLSTRSRYHCCCFNIHTVTATDSRLYFSVYDIISTDTVCDWWLLVECLFCSKWRLIVVEDGERAFCESHRSLSISPVYSISG